LAVSADKKKKKKMAVGQMIEMKRVDLIGNEEFA
jgi:hypothetical protein